ncbi:hypothetical protein D9756_002627 [Leucocoprinus leucothites]|uniref:Diaminohydroxyphosphoribosylamino-pyrimidine deaminase n=1 Tax=Leucocoprinus leucothites TaxID=201217 RepID=A0A8H5GBK4_9AGAR|nr:hypothetical protein D9756_002627 [Leucoagaricus leucothites]
MPIAITVVPSDAGQRFRGLGHVDSRKDTLTVTIELMGGNVPNDATEATAPKENRKLARHRNRTRARHIADKTIEVNIAQNTTALRSRKGDTGSVIWHASLDFARSILQQAHLPIPGSLFDFEKLKQQHVFELGAGTGVLSILLSSLCRKYTATDILELIPLIQKNIDMNISGASPNPTNTCAQTLDWIELKNTPPHRRRALFPVDDAIDLLLVVDCIYHPSLLPALIETMDYLASPNQTAVLVVSELRSEQVIREFLELWLALPDWMIFRVSNLVFGPYVVWIGQKDVGIRV